MARWARCRRCGEAYWPGTYNQHTRSLAHQRVIRIDAKIRRKKAREQAAWKPA